MPNASCAGSDPPRSALCQAADREEIACRAQLLLPGWPSSSSLFSLPRWRAIRQPESGFAAATPAQNCTDNQRPASLLPKPTRVNPRLIAARGVPPRVVLIPHPGAASSSLAAQPVALAMRFFNLGSVGGRQASSLCKPGARGSPCGLHAQGCNWEGDPGCQAIQPPIPY